MVLLKPILEVFFIAAIDNDITITASELLLDSIPFFFDANDLGGTPLDIQIQNTVTGVTLTLGTNTPGLLTLDGGAVTGPDNLLTDRIELTSFHRPVTNPYDNTLLAAQQFQAALEELRQGLLDHELITYV